MSVLRSVQIRLVDSWRKRSDAIFARSGKPGLWRRILAGLIDRMVPLPFLAFFFPQWAAVVFLYHLLCDSSPERRSFGKWVCRLRVVSADTGKKCAWWRAVLRRTGAAFSQSAWCMWQWLPVVLLYELATLACLLISPTGRRLEDLLTATRVVTERCYRSRQKHQQIT